MNRGDLTLSLLCGLMMLASMTGVTMAGQYYTSAPHPALFGSPINVTLRLTNLIKDRKFVQEVTVINQQQTWLVNFLNAAADINGFFNYTATYYSKLGYFINTINKVPEATDKSAYWSLIDAKTGIPLQCGVSSFVPNNDDVILFTLTNS